VRAATAPRSVRIQRSSHSETVGEPVRFPVTRSTVSRTISRILAWRGFPPTPGQLFFAMRPEFPWLQLASVFWSISESIGAGRLVKPQDKLRTNKAISNEHRERGKP